MHQRHLVCAAVLAALSSVASADGVAPGSLIVSRTVYSGNANTVTVGQALPGGGKAVANGAFPNVFKNESADAAFGVTAPIYLDQMTTSGTRTGSIAIDPNQLSTSFASKSELGLNISQDGKSVTFMGYVSPINQLDVSNSNTPGVVDPTNAVKSSVQRGIANVNLSTGALTVTGINAYSGNNGRNAVLAGGNYYTVGNAGNSGKGVSGTVLSQLSDDTGVQMIATGHSGNTTVVGQTYGTAGSTTGYQHGFSTVVTGGAADKTGKDDNFRGETLFNNTLYVTKGSGGNGVNTVYQVGTAGQLPTAATASSTLITPLAGFPTSGTSTHPFGLWFANATTLFVADEGDGQAPGTAGKDTSNAGLDEYTLRRRQVERDRGVPAGPARPSSVQRRTTVAREHRRIAQPHRQGQRGRLVHAVRDNVDRQQRRHARPGRGSQRTGVYHHRFGLDAAERHVLHPRDRWLRRAPGWGRTGPGPRARQCGAAFRGRGPARRRGASTPDGLTAPRIAGPSQPNFIETP